MGLVVAIRPDGRTSLKEQLVALGPRDPRVAIRPDGRTSLKAARPTPGRRGQWVAIRPDGRTSLKALDTPITRGQTQMWLSDLMVGLR